MTRMVRQEFVAELLGEVNGQPIQVYGQGSILRDLGVTAGTYMVRKLPDYFDPKLLAACLVTGYPSACAGRTGLSNPFGLRNYSYTRRMQFSNGGELQLDVRCEQTNNRLASTFQLTGELIAPNVGDPGPIVESWLPVSESAIDGDFEIEWGEPDGSTPLRLRASSKYVIDDRLPEVPRRASRSIAVTPRMVSEHVLSLFQLSHLD